MVFVLFCVSGEGVGVVSVNELFETGMTRVVYAAHCAPSLTN